MTITPDQHLQLIGLLTLARDYTMKLIEIERSMGAIVEVDESGHVSDAIWGYPNAADASSVAGNVATLLSRLEIEVTAQ